MHFAHIVNGTVTEVVVVNAETSPTEAAGAAFLAQLLGGEWVLTHYPVGQPDPYPRECYAAPGYTWDGTAFANPNPVPNHEGAP